MSTEDQQFKQKYGLGVMETYFRDKENNQLQTGVDPTNLGLDFQQKGLCQRFVSPFAESTKQPDPLNHSYQPPKPKASVTVNKEFFQKFPEETHFYIFYNQQDEQQQMWAVECLYSKGWKYHYHHETWIKDLIPQGNNNFSCKYFNIQKWALSDVSQITIDLDKDLCTVEDFEESLKQ